MNKKIIALIVMIPMILMVIILSVTKVVGIGTDVPPKSVEMLNHSVEVRFIDDWQELIAKAKVNPDLAKQAVTFSSENDYIAKVDAKTGVITPVNEGKVKIYAQSNYGNVKNYFTLILKYYYASKIKLSDMLIGDKVVETVYINDTFQINATFDREDIQYSTIEWSVSQPSILSLNRYQAIEGGSKAEFTALSHGEVEVTATYCLADGTPIKDQDGNLIQSSKPIMIGEKAPAEKVIERIEIISGLSQTVDYYKIGAAILVNQIVVKIYYTSDEYAPEVKSLSSEDVHLTDGAILNGLLPTNRFGNYAFTLFDTEQYFTYSVAEKRVKEIYLTGALSDMASQHILNVQLLLQDIIVHVVYANSMYEEEQFALSEEKIELLGNTTISNGEFVTSQAGKYQFKIIGFDDIISFEIMKKEVVDFAVVNLRNIYTVGDMLQVDHAYLKVHYSYAPYNNIVALDEKWIGAFSTSVPTTTTTTITYGGKTIAFSYTVERLEVQEISIKTVFDEFLLIGDVSWMTALFTVIDLEGNVAEIPLAEMMVMGDNIDVSTPGVKYITLRYGGLEKQFRYVVVAREEDIPEKIVASIELYSDIKTVYKLGEVLDLSKIQIKVCYTNPIYEDRIITEGFTLSGDLTFSQAGAYAIIITLDTVAIEIPYHVLDKTVKSITLLQTLQFLINQSVDLNQILLRVTYQNGYDSETIALAEALLQGIFDTSVPGDYPLTIEYHGFETEIRYTVLAKAIASIMQYTKPVFKIGEPVDLSKLYIVVTYTNSLYPQELVALNHPDIILDKEIDTTMNGNIGISFHGATCQFRYTISSKVVASLHQNHIPSYIIGEKVDIASLSVLVKYVSDYEAEDISLSSCELTGEFNTSSAGISYLTVTYHGVSVEFQYRTIAKEIQSISIADMPKLILKEDITNILTTIKFKITYTDSRYQDEYRTLNEASITGLSTSSLGLFTMFITYEGKTTSITYEVVPAIGSAMFLKSGLSVHLLNSSIDLSNIFLHIVTLDGTLEVVSVTKDMLVGVDHIDTSVLGLHSIRVRYHGIIGDFDYLVVNHLSDAPKKEIIRLTFYQSWNNQFHLNDIVLLEGQLFIVSYTNSIYNDEIIAFTADMLLDTIDTSTAGEKLFTLQYEEYAEQFCYVVLEKTIINITLVGFNENATYLMDSILQLNSIMVTITYGNGYGSERVTLTEDMITEYNGIIHNGRLETDKIQTYQFKLLDYHHSFTYHVIAREIAKFEIESGWKNIYYLGDIIDLTKIVIRITYVDGGVKRFNLTQDLVEDFTGATALGDFTLCIHYQGEQYAFDYQVIPLAIASIAITSGWKYYYLMGEILNLEAVQVLITYTNGVTKQICLADQAITLWDATDLTSRFLVSTSTIGKYSFKMEYDGIFSEATTLHVLPIFYDLNDISSMNNTITFNLSLYRNNVTLAGYTGSFALKLAYDQNVATVKAVYDEKNATYSITVTFKQDDAVGEILVVSYQLDDNRFTIMSSVSVVREISNFTNNIPEYIQLDVLTSASLTAPILPNNATYTWTSSNPTIISVVWKQNIAQLKGLNVGTADIVVTVRVGTSTKTYAQTVTVVDPYQNLIFASQMGESDNTEREVVGKFNIDPKNHVSNPYILAENTFQLTSTSHPSIDPAKLDWWLSDSTYATIDQKGILTITGEFTGTKAITLYARDKDNTLLGKTSAAYTASKTILISTGVNVYTYEELVIATESDQEVVLKRNINLGAPLNVNNTSSAAEKAAAAALLQAETKKLPTTADWTWYQNVGQIRPDIRYCINFTNNLYGNGFILNSHNITTVLDRVNYTPIHDVSVFKGPLVLVSLQNIASVMSQDNVSFLITNPYDRDLLIDNVEFTSCNDEFLYEYNAETGKTSIQMTRLNYLGTTVEVMGDNVTIDNAKINNGRTGLRIFGDVRESDKKINVAVKHSVLSMSREFNLKIGTNQSLKGSIWQDPEKTILKSDIFGGASPSLPKQSNGNYPHLVDNNMADPYFMEHYVKTLVSLENSVLMTSGLFSIGLESQFAGPVLDGYTLMDYNFKDFGWINIAGTSYPLILKLIGDVRIYDWKNIKNVDSSTLIEVSAGGANSPFNFDIKKMFEFAVQKDPQKYGNLLTKVMIDGKEETVVHGGIASYGGGKNYHCLDFSEFTGYNFAGVIKDQDGKNKIVNPYTIGMDVFQEMGEIYSVIQYASGKEPFRFFMYDKAETSFTYAKQQLDFANGTAFDCIKPKK